MLVLSAGLFGVYTFGVFGAEAEPSPRWASHGFEGSPVTVFLPWRVSSLGSGHAFRFPLFYARFALPDSESWYLRSVRRFICLLLGGWHYDLRPHCLSFA